jgi:hypothetical protein
MGCAPLPASHAYRIREEIVSALSQLSSVRRIASFGSVAEGRADAWSDLDLLVACEDVCRAAWYAAAAIRAAKPVVFYRMFTGVPQPSGRYWFAGETPFNRLDVSFHSLRDFEAMCRAGHYNDHPIATRMEYVAESAVDTRVDSRRHPASPILAISQAEAEAGRLLYFHIEAVKERLRGLVGQRDSRDTRAALMRALAVRTEAGGGHFIGLAGACLDL